MGIFSALLCDAALLAASPPSAEAAVAAHRATHVGDAAGRVGPLLAEDTRLAELDRSADTPLEVIVHNTGGAGGLTALARRTFSRLRPVGVISPLRDPDDLPGNAARVAAAARELDPDVDVYVAFPTTGSSDQPWPMAAADHPETTRWQDAVAAAEAEGLFASVDLRLPAEQLAEQLSAFVEADIGFHAGILQSETTPGLLALIAATDALIDDAQIERAVDILRRGEQEFIVSVGSYDEARISRVRRRLRRVSCADLPAILDRLPAMNTAT